MYKTSKQQRVEKNRRNKNRNVYYPNSIEWDPWGPLGRKHMINHMVNFSKII